jgi:hypothetical protein
MGVVDVGHLRDFDDAPAVDTEVLSSASPSAAPQQPQEDLLGLF